MKKYLTPIVCTLALLALAGCSTAPRVHTYAKTGTDYTRYRTFALMPLPARGPANDPGLMLVLAEPARQAVVEVLAAKGLTEADRTQADIAVNLRGQFLPKVEVADLGYHAAPVYGPSGGYQVRTYEERTLNIEIFDNHTKEVIWVGWSRREAHSQVDVERVQQAISNILAKFPPGATSSKP
jgi:hypothetical protein